MELRIIITPGTRSSVLFARFLNSTCGQGAFSHGFCFYFILFCFWPLLLVCGILFSQLGTELGLSAVKAPSPKHWTTREFLAFAFSSFNFFCFSFFFCLNALSSSSISSICCLVALGAFSCHLRGPTWCLLPRLPLHPLLWMLEILAIWHKVNLAFEAMLAHLAEGTL